MGFYAAVQAELSPRIRRYLGHRPFSEEDCEDCVSIALQGLVERQDVDRQAIQDPHAYLWRSAKNAANDLLRQRARASESFWCEGDRLADLHVESNQPEPDWNTDDTDGRHTPKAVDLCPAPLGGDDDAEDDGADAQSFSVEAAVTLIEGLVDGVETDPGWVVRVVRVAVRRLPQQPRRVALHILRFGPDYNSSESPLDLGMNESTYRSNKRRAFKALQGLILAVMGEMGIDPKRHGVDIPDVGFRSREPSFPSDVGEGSEGD